MTCADRRCRCAENAGAPFLKYQLSSLLNDIEGLIQCQENPISFHWKTQVCYLLPCHTFTDCDIYCVFNQWPWENYRIWQILWWGYWWTYGHLIRHAATQSAVISGGIAILEYIYNGRGTTHVLWEKLNTTYSPTRQRLGWSILRIYFQHRWKLHSIPFVHISKPGTGCSCRACVNTLINLIIKRAKYWANENVRPFDMQPQSIVCMSPTNWPSHNKKEWDTVSRQIVYPNNGAPSPYPEMLCASHTSFTSCRGCTPSLFFSVVNRLSNGFRF